MNVTVNVAELMPALPALLGLVVAVAVELVTRAGAPAPVKRSVAAVLALLAGVIPTVTLTPHQTPGGYAGAVLSAWVVAITAHAAGLTGWAQAATAGVGIGRTVSAPADPVRGTPSMTAGAPAGEPEIEQFPAEQPAPAVIVQR